jgi:hypothetical protein
VSKHKTCKAKKRQDVDLSTFEDERTCWLNCCNNVGRRYFVGSYYVINDRFLEVKLVKQ